MNHLRIRLPHYFIIFCILSIVGCSHPDEITMDDTSNQSMMMSSPSGESSMQTDAQVGGATAGTMCCAKPMCCQYFH